MGRVILAREAAYKAIDESEGLAALSRVKNGHRGAKGKALIYVDGTFDLDAVVRAVLASVDTLPKGRDAAERLDAEQG